MIQFPRKEEPQNINLKSNINPKRNIIDTIDTVNENSESEIKSIKDKARKKYQSSSVERNSHNYSQNNTAPRLEKAPINNYERIQTYQKINFNNNNLSSLNNTNNTNTNSTVIQDTDLNNKNRNNKHKNLNLKDEVNDMNPQELKIKELEKKIRLLEKKLPKYTKIRRNSYK